jgi:hypothetical protein
MRVSNFILILLVIICFCGCYAGPATYEVFERNMNFNIGTALIPKTVPEKREIYSDDKYIYKGRIGQCNYGFLTNRDDKPEKVIGWIILSGKEFCKEQQAYGFQI